MTYHDQQHSAVSGSSGSSGSSGRSPEVSAALAALEREHDFLAGLRLVAHCLLASVPDLTDTERAYLKDVAREAETRYPMRNIQRMADFSRRSRNASHRHAFAELVRKHSDTPSAVDLIAASNRETDIQGKADVAVRALEQRPSPLTKRLAEQAVSENLAAERDLLDAIEHTRVA